MEESFNILNEVARITSKPVGSISDSPGYNRKMPITPISRRQKTVRSKNTVFDSDPIPVDESAAKLSSLRNRVFQGSSTLPTPKLNLINAQQTVVPVRTPRQMEPDTTFSFACNGDIGGKSDIAGSHIEWKANFDRPLEQFVYPSLQRFDLTDWLEHRNIEVMKYGADAFVEEEPLYLDTDLDLKFEDQKLFVHTPSWSANITGKTNANLSPTEGSAAKTDTTTSTR